MFQLFEWSTGPLFDERNGQYPSELLSWNDGQLDLADTGTHFGFVESGQAELECDAGRFRIREGMYFSVPHACRINGKAGRGIVMSRHGFMGFFQLGGPIEQQGRLRYIDGCSDSLLIPPVVCGDPCLNLLYIPPGTAQTQHTHPSLRAGVIVSGTGMCCTPERNVPLTPGTVFVIPAETAHSFHTRESALRVIAWHPDSDTGPCHDDHPMVNRTIVNGISAADIPEIRT